MPLEQGEVDQIQAQLRMDNDALRLRVHELEVEVSRLRAVKAQLEQDVGVMGALLATRDAADRAEGAIGG